MTRTPFWQVKPAGISGHSTLLGLGFGLGVTSGAGMIEFPATKIFVEVIAELRVELNSEFFEVQLEMTRSEPVTWTT